MGKCVWGSLRKCSSATQYSAHPGHSVSSGRIPGEEEEEEERGGGGGGVEEMEDREREREEDRRERERVRKRGSRRGKRGIGRDESVCVCVCVWVGNEKGIRSEEGWSASLVRPAPLISMRFHLSCDH